MFIIMQAGVIISFKSVFYITPLNLIILLINLQPFLGEKGNVSHMSAKQRLLMILLQVFNLQTLKNSILLLLKYNYRRKCHKSLNFKTFYKMIELIIKSPCI